MKILITLYLLILALPLPVFAQSPTTSKSQEILDLVEQKVKEKLDQLDQNFTPNPKKAYLGTITDIKDNKIKIDTKGQIMEFVFADNTVFIGSKQNKIKKEDLKVGQDILLISLTQDTISYTKRIIIADPKKIENHKSVTLGQIADISQTSPVLVLIPLNNKNHELQIKLSTDTVYLDDSGKKIKSTDLKKGQKIICIYDNSSSPTFPAIQIISLLKQSTTANNWHSCFCC